MAHQSGLGWGESGLNFVETGVADGRLFVQAGGNVGVGTSNPAAKLDVRGDILLPHAELSQTSLGGGFFVLTQANNIDTVRLEQDPHGGGQIKVFGSNGNEALQVTQNSQNGGQISLFAAGGSETVRLSQNPFGGGNISLLGPSGNQTVVLSGVMGFPNKGFVAVTDETQTHTSAMTFDTNGNSVVVA